MSDPRGGDGNGIQPTRAERGTQYPGETLEAALAMLAKIREAVGFNEASRQDVAEALGHSTLSGNANRKIGSLTHFDLLERTGKGALRISPLGKAILMPTREEERRQAIIQAAKSPNLYAGLIERHKGEALPTLLPNILVREHGILASVADGAARTFRETMEFAGLMRNGILYDAVSESAVDEREVQVVAAPVDDGRSTTGSSAAPRQRNHDSAIADGITIPLDATGRMATIHIPLPITARDLKRISAWVTYMEAVLEDDETPAISGN